MSRCLLLILLLVQIWAAHSWQPKFHLGRAMFGMQTDDERFSMRNPDEEINLPRDSDAKTDYIEQKLDHFDDSSQERWRQRYYYNFKYTGGSNNIKAVFLRLGGEGPLRIGTVSNEANQMMTLAKQYGAAAFALEHRFYGVSRPTPNQSVKNLKYLSSHQALKDTAYFIQKMTDKYKLKGARWITFGGSYAGALSLWFRQQYPHLIAGAVGSSAPLDAEFDFWGYLEVVEDALRSQHSNACAENVRKGFQKMTALMKSKEGREQLSKIFVLKAPLANITLSYNNIQYFYQVIYENFQLATQYNEVNVNPYKSGYGIKQVCDIMTKGNDDPLTKLQAVNVYMAQLHGDFKYTDNSYDDMIKYLRREEFDGENFDSGARSWTWQTCTEFGYYQTTDGGPKGIFGDVTPLSVFVNMCTDVFGTKFNANYIDAAVRATQTHYGGADNFMATNVVIPNGSVDPWHRLGKLVSYYTSVVTYLINGTAHCAEMSPPGPNDKPGLKKVREIIQQNVEKWLTEPRSQLTVNTNKKNAMPRARTTYPKQDEETAENRILQSQMKFPPWVRHRRMFFGRPPEGFVSPPEINYDAKHILAVETHFIRQPFDHFNSEDNRTFKQKYYKNDEWAKPNGPMFLLIGGESPLGPMWVKGFGMFHQKLAEKLGATVFALEHRYYGDSVVGGTATDPNPDLTYLSSLQALSDVANFIRTMDAKMNKTSKWITFGGSYAGSLSLWMRQAFPDLVRGAVGSSAPVEAKLDFYEYLEVVERSFRRYQPQCADNIAKGFEEIHDLVLTKSGRKKLSDTFTLVPPWNENTIVSDLDVQFFFQTIYGVYQGMVQQENCDPQEIWEQLSWAKILQAFRLGAYKVKPETSASTVPPIGEAAFRLGYFEDHRDEVCRVMTNKTNTPLQNMAYLNERIIEYWQQSPFNGTDNSYADVVEFLKTAQKYGPESATMRLWIWQTCTEFGYYQSTDSGYSIFGSPTPLNFYTRICVDVYGDQYKAAVIEKSIRMMNKLYGGRDKYEGSNVVATNGNVDPWHALGLYKSNDSSVVSFLLNGGLNCTIKSRTNPFCRIRNTSGTSHCADMFSPITSDIVKAQALIEQNVRRWLTEEITSTPRRTTNPTLKTSIPTKPTTAGPTTTSKVANYKGFIFAVLYCMLVKVFWS
ncbi:hypothetical protein Y032_0048g1549 [Ancylostoma ceylanicum]|uniref:Serine carboxypeptidase S28 n=1 Tax=Ancylostoma ceylanicum TaxID=53326 RepID=A0A016UA11_9BILA|nr:hypothetical protein Y032_0048g1549 [Ancylostoma ceylanicum]